jgi:hypothetical protein
MEEAATQKDNATIVEIILVLAGNFPLSFLKIILVHILQT